MQIVAPIIIVCGERYAKLASISVKSFLKCHDECLYIVADDVGADALSAFSSDKFFVVSIEGFVKIVKSYIKTKEFFVFDYDKDGRHDRTYSALKPLIMHEAIKQLRPGSQYILSLDADTIFTGNIIKRTQKYLESVKHKFDFYMVARNDPRMQRLSGNTPGSGFTLWKRNSEFINVFRDSFTDACGGKMGGSQNLINSMTSKLAYREIDDPFLHFVCPNGPSTRVKMSDEDILKLKPAYIHCHGAKKNFLSSYDRLLKYYNLFFGDVQDDSVRSDV